MFIDTDIIVQYDSILDIFLHNYVFSTTNSNVVTRNIHENVHTQLFRKIQIFTLGGTCTVPRLICFILTMLLIKIAVNFK